MTIRLIQCDQYGEPVEELGALPRELAANCEATAKLYASIGFEPPWVGYVTVENDSTVGGCAFVGAPKDGMVEIAYFTLNKFEGRGYSTQAVKCMIEIAWLENSAVSIFAKTLPEDNASTAILENNGFQHIGETHDEDIGLAWAWILNPTGKSELG